MPVAHINLLQGHSPEALRQIIVDVSDAMSRILVAPKDRLYVWITQHDLQLFGLGGVPASEALKHGDRRALEMPYVEMVLMKGRPREQFTAIMDAVTAIVARHARCDPQRIRIHIVEGNPDNWAIGGVPASLARAAELASRAQGAA